MEETSILREMIFLQCDETPRQEESWTSLAGNEPLNLFQDLGDEILIRENEGGDRENKRFECSFCDKRFDFLSKLSRHLTVHSKRKEFSCESCEKSFSRLDVLRLHFAKKHEQGSEHGSKYPCPKCPASLRTPQTLRRHLLSHESKVGLFSCPFCSKEFTDKRKYQMHSRGHSDRKFECRRCGARFLQKEFLNRHERALHSGGENPQVVRCDLCSKDFSCLSNLKKHNSRLHPPDYKRLTDFLCAHCGKTFFTKNELDKHSLYHFNSRRYKCHLCESKFVEKGHLDRHHRRVHGGGFRPYSCSLCDKTFYEKYELNYHLKTSH